MPTASVRQYIVVFIISMKLYFLGLNFFEINQVVVNYATFFRANWQFTRVFALPYYTEKTAFWVS